MNFKNVVAAVAVLGAVTLSVDAAAQTADLNVTAEVIASCTIAEDAPVAFGNYDPVVANLNADLQNTTGGLSVTCSVGSAYTIALDNGDNAVGAVRNMSDGAGALLSYELYSDPARTQAWNATTLVSRTADSINPFVHAVYGIVPSGQNAPVGSYTDIVTATIVF